MFTAQQACVRPRARLAAAGLASVATRQPATQKQGCGAKEMLEVMLVARRARKSRTIRLYGLGAFERCAGSAKASLTAAGGCAGSCLEMSIGTPALGLLARMC